MWCFQLCIVHPAASGILLGLMADSVQSSHALLSALYSMTSLEDCCMKSMETHGDETSGAGSNPEVSGEDSNREGVLHVFCVKSREAACPLGAVFIHYTE